MDFHKNGRCSVWKMNQTWLERVSYRIEWIVALLQITCTRYFPHIFTKKYHFLNTVLDLKWILEILHTTTDKIRWRRRKQDFKFTHDKQHWYEIFEHGWDKIPELFYLILINIVIFVVLLILIVNLEIMNIYWRRKHKTHLKT